MSTGKTMSKRKEFKEKKLRRERRQRLFTILIIAVVALLILGVAIAPTIRYALTPVGTIVQITPQAYPNVDKSAMGDPNAPVKMIEYSDFQCPFCKQFNDQTEEQIINTYVRSGKVYLVYKSMGNFVSDNINRTAGGSDTESQNAAEAAYCAGDQGKFWAYHDTLFANQKGENEGDFSDKRLVAFAQALGLDMNQFNSCFNSHKYRAQVQQDAIDGQNAAVDSTPSFLINGKKLTGALPFSNFQTEIDAALAAVK